MSTLTPISLVDSKTMTCNFIWTILLLFYTSKTIDAETSIQKIYRVLITDMDEKVVESFADEESLKAKSQADLSRVKGNALKFLRAFEEVSVELKESTAFADSGTTEYDVYQFINEGVLYGVKQRIKKETDFKKYNDMISALHEQLLPLYKYVEKLKSKSSAKMRCASTSLLVATATVVSAFLLRSFDTVL